MLRCAEPSAALLPGRRSSGISVDPPARSDGRRRTLADRPQRRKAFAAGSRSQRRAARPERHGLLTPTERRSWNRCVAMIRSFVLRLHAVAFTLARPSCTASPLDPGGAPCVDVCRRRALLPDRVVLIAAAVAASLTSEANSGDPADARSPRRSSKGGLTSFENVCSASRPKVNGSSQTV
jgi:hypothetical protein